MKVIGLIGGMSWESSLEYYRLINTGVKRRLGGHYSAKILMHSVNFEEVERYQSAGEWDKAAEVIVDAGKRLKAGGAEMQLICANTMHIVAEALTSAVDLPFIHIGDCMGREIKSMGFNRVGLLGTSFTMEKPFLKNMLLEKYDLEIMIPPKKSRDLLHQIIYDELCHGVVSKESKKWASGMIRELESSGAEAVILGCTELPMLIEERDSVLPVFDSTELHANAAVEAALAE